MKVLLGDTITCTKCQTSNPKINWFCDEEEELPSFFYPSQNICLNCRISVAAWYKNEKDIIPCLNCLVEGKYCEKHKADHCICPNKVDIERMLANSTEAYIQLKVY